MSTIISNAMSSVTDENYGGDSSTDLNSDKNMVVVGKHVEILADTRNWVDLSPFKPYHQAMYKV